MAVLAGVRSVHVSVTNTLAGATGALEAAVYGIHGVDAMGHSDLNAGEGACNGAGASARWGWGLNKLVISAGLRHSGDEDCIIFACAGRIVFASTQVSVHAAPAQVRSPADDG